MEILNENAVESTAAPLAKQAGAGAVARKPRRALGDITNGGAKQKKGLGGGKPGLGGGKKQGGLGGAGKGPSAKRPSAKAAVEVFAFAAPEPAQEYPDIEHAQVGADDAGIDWMMEEIGIDVDQLMGNLVGGTTAGPTKLRGVLKGGEPAEEALADDFGIGLDAAALLGVMDQLAPEADNGGDDDPFSICLGDFEFD